MEKMNTQRILVGSPGGRSSRICKCGGKALIGLMWLGIVPRSVSFEQGVCLLDTMKGV
jgi:hypothetical protein